MCSPSRRTPAHDGTRSRGDGSLLNLGAEEAEESIVVGWAAQSPSREEDRESGDGELPALYAASDRIGAVSARR